MNHVASQVVKQLCALNQADFTASLAHIFEHSPWIAERAWHKRPFATLDDLHQAMVKVVHDADASEQLALIQAHPELAGKEAASGTLTDASATEQQGAGLDQCSPDELARLRQLNHDYHTRFGFPFIIAVKGLSRYDIMDALASRLHNDAATEQFTCLTEISKIARFRLDALSR